MKGRDVILLFQVYLIYLLVLSIAAYVAYGRDKRLAKQHKWRTPERTLLLLGFLGGAAGALAAMQVFRHKTKHWYFWIVNLLGLLWQIGVIILLLYRRSTS